MLDQRITVNATGTGEKAVVRMVYGDTGRRIIASFEDYTIPAGATAEISFERPSGTVYMVPGTITGQDVSFEADQMTTETGYTVATLTITEADGRVSSFPFYCYVAKCADGSPLTPEEAISLVILAAKVEILEEAVKTLQNRFPIGTADIQDTAVTTDKIADGAVGTDKIANGAVTRAKLDMAINKGSGTDSIKEGQANRASGQASHAEGLQTNSEGMGSHAEGVSSTASATGSHAEGGTTNASGSDSHAEGCETSATGSYSHAEGQFSYADGTAAHAEGRNTGAKGNYSHSEGLWTEASSECQHVQGKYNVKDAANTYADIVGCGSAYNSRKNIEATTWTGDKRMKGDVYIQCNDDSTGGKKVATEEYVGAQGFLTEVPDGSVTTGKIADGAVTNNKVALTKLNMGGNANLSGNYALIVGGATGTIAEWTGIGQGQTPGPSGANAASLYSYGGNVFMSIASGNTHTPPSTISGTASDYQYWLPALYQSGTIGSLIVGNGAVMGNRSVSLGQGCCVFGNQSFAAGGRNLVTKTNSSALGVALISNHGSQLVLGQFNIPHEGKLIVGSGSGINARKNVLFLDNSGNLHVAGKLYQNATSDDGTDGEAVPATTPPTTDGRYVWVCTVTNGTPAYSWEAY